MMRSSAAWACLCSVLLSSVVGFSQSRVEPSRTQPPVSQLLDDWRFSQALSSLAKSPRVRIEKIGETLEGRSIPLIIVALPGVLADLERHRQGALDLAVARVDYETLATPRVKPQDFAEIMKGLHLPVMFAGASWGHEAAQVEGLLKAARFLAFDEGEEAKRALSRTIALFIPLMNPDGRAKALEEWKNTPLSRGNSGVGNSYGFMINRDFVHATQLESRALVETTLRWRPVAAIDQHEDMFNLGVRLPQVCFVEPFSPGFDVEEHPISRLAVIDLGQAIAQRWSQLGFQCLFDPKGDTKFAPLPKPGEGINPVAGSAGRLNLMWNLHGIPGFITESARTPGSQTWEDRVEQKAASAIATLLEVSARPDRYGWAIFERRRQETAGNNHAFVAIPLENQPADGLLEIVRILSLHHIQIFRVAAPYPALLIPLDQPETAMASHLLLGERSKLNWLPGALGLKVVSSGSLPAGQRDTFLTAPLDPGVLLPAQPVDGHYFLLRPGVGSTALANEWALSGIPVRKKPEGYMVTGSANYLNWRASLLGIPLRKASEVEAEKGPLTRLPKIAVYGGQGIAPAAWGEVVWALEAGKFPYRVLDESHFSGEDPLGGVDVLIMPDGSAEEIKSGVSGKMEPPWQAAAAPAGLGAQGLEAIRKFVEKGGTYIGFAGGAALAGKDFLGITATDMPASNAGMGVVRLRPAAKDSPLLWGYDFEQPLYAFVVDPPGTSGRGVIFKAGDSAVARYAGVHQIAEEMSFRAPDLLTAEAGYAAIVYDRWKEGKVVLFGIAPVFRGQWRHTFQLLYNAITLGTAEQATSR